MFNSPSWVGSDESTRQRFERAALNTSNSGDKLLQTFINRTVQMLTLREFGLQSVLERRPGSGNAEYINQRAAGTSGGIWVQDTSLATLAEEVGSYSQVSFEYKTLLSRGKVTRKLQATGRSYADILALELAAKAEDFANQLEKGYLLGDTSGNLYNGAIAAQVCNGFLTQIQGVNSFDLSQSVGQAQGPVNLKLLDQTIDLVKGSANRSDLAIIGSFAGIRQVNAVLQSTQRFNDMTEIAAGFRVRSYDGIPLIASTMMPNVMQTNADGMITNVSGGGNTALLVVNKRYCYISELTPMTVMPIAKTSSQFDEFDMFTDVAPVLSNTLGAALYTGITTS